MFVLSYKGQSLNRDSAKDAKGTTIWFLVSGLLSLVFFFNQKPATINQKPKSLSWRLERSGRFKEIRLNV
jgi:hypothetical protein